MLPVPAPKRRRRRLAFALIAAAIGFALAVTLLEVGLRLAWTPPSAMAEFQQKGLYQLLPSGNAGLTPGYRGTLQLGPEQPVTRISIDSLGMRGPVPAPDQPGARRLLIVGDSLVFGYGVDDDQTFCRRLEADLRRDGRGVTIGNGGLSGSNDFENARRIADLRPGFRPDAVLFCHFLGNDAFENRNTDVAVVGGLRFAGPYARLMQRSARARWMARSRLWLWTEAWLVVNRPAWSLLGDLEQVWPNPALHGFPDRLDGCLFLDVVDPAGAGPTTRRRRSRW